MSERMSTRDEIDGGAPKEIWVNYHEYDKTLEGHYMSMRHAETGRESALERPIRYVLAKPKPAKRIAWCVKCGTHYASVEVCKNGFRYRGGRLERHIFNNRDDAVEFTKKNYGRVVKVRVPE